MKKLTLLCLLLITNVACAAGVVRGEKCPSDGTVAKSTTAAIMTCQNGKYEHVAFGMINVHLIAGQIAQDPGGCLYAVTAEKDTFSLKPVNGDDGKQLCGRVGKAARGEDLSLMREHLARMQQEMTRSVALDAQELPYDQLRRAGMLPR